ncbi:unnamed protein product [Rhizophagus irregularis]|nr:unnamed protein product [Rhizophagus irregularis]CAB5303044.1 unnamed protein product [Rhizophagus irregularis]
MCKDNDKMSNWEIQILWFEIQAFDCYGGREQRWQIEHDSSRILPKEVVESHLRRYHSLISGKNRETHIHDDTINNKCSRLGLYNLTSGYAVVMILNENLSPVLPSG